MKPAYFSEIDSRSGVDVTFYRATQKVVLGGWYDSFVGICPVEVTLVDFLKRIGCRPADLRKAAKEMER
jgi:hypothetical protein